MQLTFEMISLRSLLLLLIDGAVTKTCGTEFEAQNKSSCLFLLICVSLIFEFKYYIRTFKKH